MGFNKFYKWIEEKPYLSPYVKEKQYRSYAVVCVDVDEKYNCTDLIRVLEEKQVVYGIDSYRKLGRNQFRIAIFHNIRLRDLVSLTQLISAAIESV